MMKHSMLAVLAFAITAMVPARADVLTYSFSTIGSGNLDGSNFTNQPVTVSMTPTTLIISGSGPYVLTGTFGVIVPGTGGDLFTGNLSEFVSGDGIIAAVVGTTPGSIPDLLGVSEGALNYNFETAVGPITTTGIFSPGTLYATTAGTFDLTAIGQ
jgi:hypothetical protein